MTRSYYFVLESKESEATLQIYTRPTDPFWGEIFRVHSQPNFKETIQRMFADCIRRGEWMDSLMFVTYNEGMYCAEPELVDALFFLLEFMNSKECDLPRMTLIDDGDIMFQTYRPES